MSLRNKLEEYKTPVALVAIAICGIGVALMARNAMQGRNYGFEHPKWMFDLNTQKLVAAPADMLVPSTSESGPFDYPELGSGGALVDAVVLTCGKPTAIREGMSLEDLEAIDARVVYLLRPPPGEEGPGPAGNQWLLSTPDGQNWVGRLSAEGMRINAEAYAQCPDGDLPVQSVP